MSNAARTTVAAAAALALADASIVTLALPDIAAELGASVMAAAGVLGAYAAATAVALWWIMRVGVGGRGSVSGMAGTAGAAGVAGTSWASGTTSQSGADQASRATRQIGLAGLALFAAASLACGLAGSVPMLIAFRAVQGIGAAAILAAAFAALDGGGAGRSLWQRATVAGAAAGPAVGGVLTELADWRGVFLAQVPVVLAAGVALWATTQPRVRPAPAPSTSSEPITLRMTLVLLLVSGALTGVLFLLALLLITGWSLSPIAAAATMTVLPVAAVAGERIGGDPRTQLAAGCVLIAGGVGALAFAPTASIIWVIVPQVAAGLGMGLAYGALDHHLAPARTGREAARGLAARCAGVVIALILLAPLASSTLVKAETLTKERTTALVLDAPLGSQDKLEFVRAAAAGVDGVDPRGDVRAAYESVPVSADDEAAKETLIERTDDAVVAGVRTMVTAPMLVCGLLASIAALIALPGGAGGRRQVTLVAVLTGGMLALLAASGKAVTPPPIKLADPCQERALPDVGGFDGFAQDVVLRALDGAACRFGTTREALALALFDEEAAQRLSERTGVDLRQLSRLARQLMG